MALTDAEKKILDELKAKEGDTEEARHQKRVKWIDDQIAKEEKEATEKKEKEEKEKKEKDARERRGRLL